MNVIVHKPLANRVLEARAVIETARATKIATHFLPASEGAGQKQALDMIKNGAIGTLREIHNWSMRPMWPQFPTLPTDTPPVPAGFDWTLWLGPSLDRPYHPNYTHTNFRGWYEFGGGSIADMGHYSLWPIFQLLDLDSPISVESTPSHVCDVDGRDLPADQERLLVPGRLHGSHAIRAQGRAGAALDIFWYDGGIKPPVPEELMAENKELAEEGMLFVGDKGKILGGFRGENPQLIPEARRCAPTGRRTTSPSRPRRSRARAASRTTARACQRATPPGSTAFKGGRRATAISCWPGPICDAVNLAAISLRLGGRRLLWDSAGAKITNVPEANKFLTREYRPGWEDLTRARTEPMTVDVADGSSWQKTRQSGPARPGSWSRVRRSCAANPLGLPIGSQVWPMRSMLKDFPAFVEDDGRDRRDPARAVFADRLRRRVRRRSRTGRKSGRSWPIMA